jgi:hypothetical protein
MSRGFCCRGFAPAPPQGIKELSFLDLVHFERIAFKKAKVFGVPFLKKGYKKRLTTQDTKEPKSYQPDDDILSIAYYR